MTGCAERALENSEVSPVRVLVAVAVTQMFAGRLIDGANEMAALPLAICRDGRGADRRLSLAKARGIGNQAGEELDQERSVGQAGQCCLESRCSFRRRRRWSGPGSSEGCSGPNGRRCVGSDAAGGSPGDQVDPQLAVGVDAVGQDRIARSRLDRDAGKDIEGDRVASAGHGPADRVGGCVVADDHAVHFIAQRCLAGDVGADQVALDQVAREP